MRGMRDVVILFLHLIVTVVRLARPGGLRPVVAESLLVKHQLRILNHGAMDLTPQGRGHWYANLDYGTKVHAAST